ncbi:tripartite motif-containing protein 16-like protein [Acipenser ruthenus]|uniref:tripartite motif-containing protein 16-like protein n=1 Tax=Acipenser ruthenus TaxID=7906 RepID=UPI002741FCD8|nr:tripartite motif-containing protein 16-like protein [Acipenser ruthenus]
MPVVFLISILTMSPLLCSFTQRSACIEIKESEKIFTELIRSIEKIHTEVIELIGANEKAAVNQAEGRMKKLEQEIAELRRRDAELKQLSETEDHIHFLQNFQSLCAPPEAGDLPSVTVNTGISFGAVRKAVSELKDHIVDFCKGEIVKITTSVNEVAVYSLQAPEPRNRAEFLKSKEKCEVEMKDQPAPRRRRSNKKNRPNMSGCEGSAEEETGETEEQEPVNKVAVYSLQAPEPRNRAEFLKYSCQLTLDPNTAYEELCLSEGNRKVTRRRETQRYPDDHPERFDSWEQVLCKEGLSGTRCYWEIEWSGGWAFIGVTYKGISRKGWDGSCVLGCNDKSWSLLCSDSSYTAQHNNNETAITAPHSPRIGVYLDFNAGTLSFYGISDTMTLLHRFQTTFTEPLYPGFWLHCYDSTVTICQLN